MLLVLLWIVEKVKKKKKNGFTFNKNEGIYFIDVTEEELCGLRSSKLKHLTFRGCNSCLMLIHKRKCFSMSSVAL